MTKNVQLRCITGNVRELEEELARGLRSAQADDPLAPVAVLVGGALQRPYLQRRMAAINGGIVNVHFLMASELAVKLGERAMIAAGRRPLPPLADRILLGRIAAQTPGYFEPVGEAAGFADALHRLIRELRQAGLSSEEFETAIAGSCEVAGKEGALAAIYERFLELRHDFYGPDDCLVEAETDNPPWVEMNVVGTFDPPAALRELLARLSSEIRVNVFLPITGTEADEATQEFRGWLSTRGAEQVGLATPAPEQTTLTHAKSATFASSASPTPSLDSSLHLLSAPDPTREVREVARACLDWAREGIGFHEMVITYRHPDTYRATIEAVFREAGIPVYLHEGSPLVERPLGRRIVSLLGLIDGKLERRAVIEFITESALPKETRNQYDGFSSSRWDRISRDAGIVEGRDQWEGRLTALVNDLNTREEPERWQSDLKAAGGLLAFVRDLDNSLTQLPDRGTWAEHLAAFGALLDTYVKDAEPVINALDGLHRIDALDADVSAERFRDLANSAIEGMRDDDVRGGRAGAFARRGVNVLDVNSLQLLRFRAVAVLGLIERSFPSPPRPDPLMLDPERRRFNEASPRPLPLRVLGADTEPLQFALAVNAADERLLASFPRKAQGDSNAQLPSSFFRALAEATVGRTVPASDVDELPSELFTRAEGSRIGSTDLDIALSMAERDRSLIESDRSLGRAVLLETSPRMRAAFEQRSARFERRLTEFDGSLPPEVTELRDRYFADDRQLSVSALHTYAGCPQRFFLGNVLGIKPIEEPESVVTISALNRGSLIHKILERFLTEEAAPGEKRIHGDNEGARLLAIAEEEGRKAEELGQTGYGITWRYAQQEIGEDLLRWLELERMDPAVVEMPAGDYETRFGRAWRKGEEEGERSTDEQVELTVPGLDAPVRVGGRIDRLAWSEDLSRFRVIDYKTGSSSRMPKDGSLAGGSALQLPIYLRAGELILDVKLAEGVTGSAEYHYATRRGEFKRSEFSSADLSEREEDFGKAILKIVGGIRSGEFQMAPEKAFACEWCDFNGICPTARFRQIERKSGDPVAMSFLKMREIE